MRAAIVAFCCAAGVAGILLGCAGTSEPGGAPGASAASAHDPSELLAVGSDAPDITAKDHLGNDVKLSSFKGKNAVVLVFYPGDDTPGCTRQLCTMRDDWSKFTEKGVAVYGISPQGLESKKAFAEKYSFPFPLIADTDGKVIADYGTKGLMFTNRTVYAIGKDGKIAFAERGMPGTDKILAAIN